MILSSVNLFTQKKHLEVYELFDVSLEELLSVGIVSASKKKQSVTDAPATGYVFTDQNIRIRGYDNLLELLEDVPEVDVQRNSDREFKNLVTIRGVSGNEKFLILIDGIRITPATGDNYTFGTQFSLASAKRVEVIIGPASALYGVDAFSGIVNIITKTGEGDKYSGVEVKSSYGMYNTTDNSFFAGGKVDKLQLSVSGQFYLSNEVDLQNTYKQDFAWYHEVFKPNGYVLESPFFNKVRPLSDFEDLAFESFNGEPISDDMGMPTKSYFLNATLSSKGITLGMTRMYESHSSATGLDPRYAIRDRNAYIGSIQNSIYLQHKYSSFNKKWRLNSTLRLNTFNYDAGSNFVSAASRYQRGYVYTSMASTKLQEQLEYDFSSKVSLITGASIEFLSATPRTGLSPKPYDSNNPTSQADFYYVGAAGYNPDSLGTVIPVFNDTFAIAQELYYLSYQNYGVYGQMQWSPSKKIETTFGARFDYNTRYGGSVNPRVGLVYKPSKKARLKLLYGEAFLAPSPQKAFAQDGSFYEQNQGVLKADYFRQANPDLKPEKLRSVELSGSYFLRKNLSVGINTYFTRIENLINQFAQSENNRPVINGTQIESVTVETSKNQGQSTIYGGSFKLNYLVKLGPTVVVNLFGAYSYIDGETDGKSLTFASKHSVKSGVDIIHKKWSLVPILRYRDRVFTTLTDGVDGDRVSSPYFVLLDLVARYNILNRDDKVLGIFVKVDNITNLKYYHVNAGSVEGFALTPQDPLRVLGGINFSF